MRCLAFIRTFASADQLWIYQMDATCNTWWHKIVQPLAHACRQAAACKH